MPSAPPRAAAVKDGTTTPGGITLMLLAVSEYYSSSVGPELMIKAAATRSAWLLDCDCIVMAGSGTSTLFVILRNETSV